MGHLKNLFVVYPGAQIQLCVCWEELLLVFLFGGQATGKAASLLLRVALFRGLAKPRGKPKPFWE